MICLYTIILVQNLLKCYFALTPLDVTVVPCICLKTAAYIQISNSIGWFPVCVSLLIRGQSWPSHFIVLLCVQCIMKVCLFVL